MFTKVRFPPFAEISEKIPYTKAEGTTIHGYFRGLPMETVCRWRAEMLDYQLCVQAVSLSVVPYLTRTDMPVLAFSLWQVESGATGEMRA